MKRRSRLALTLLLGLSGLLPSSGVPASGAEPLPRRLSDTGLFVVGSTSDVEPGVLPFSPQYALWSDGATKQRWIRLPRGTAIDASRVDAWVFPPGTRLWKEFSVGRRVETRMIERQPDGAWRYASYVWREDGSDAVLAPSAGITVAGPAGPYAIPSEMDCRVCHEGGAVPVLGFTALQLSADRDPLAPHAETSGPEAVDLQSLVADGWIRNLPQQLLERPPRIVAGSPAERAVLGYLHANCGHCHSARQDADGAVPVEIVLGQRIGDLDASSRVVRSLVDARGRFRLPGSRDDARIVVPGRSGESLLVLRSRSRDPRIRMPPLGTAVPDHEALALIERWIDRNLSPVEVPAR